ncbi:1,6-anhydro-N-acetylmuramyl-L-alanine amidase AmpD [Paenalcaligenes suwonensis]|uniref:1,6-anhydro-N-acetylmuramyl-L-alanine amidase AmpD n=1 Tax=Paenalcaligenes suwonensis TaxID=1202713 RepID=UPI00140DCB91|nr:1,6-anhydro-N-acetylmuramyl-L-alanine amidase AmpD [Paenalcaligenes suwonensis]NHC60967.1 1,6-anhydro-N-acetylmuramyl-L-alanine amidase AmpD [Paenalcaligenes suwonensis]
MAPASNNALHLQADGWLAPAEGVTRAPSPNFDTRPEGGPIDLLVIHNISLPPNVFEGNAIIDFFQNKLDISSHPWFENIRGVTVSAHFLVRRDGEIVQFVSTLDRAWHAGVSNHHGREVCNDFSIGIEMEGSDSCPFEAAQYQRLNQLSQALAERHDLHAIRGHEHIAPGRKTDPGPFFDWESYASNSPWPRRHFPDLLELD